MSIYDIGNSTLQINSVTELSEEQAIELKRRGFDKVKITAKAHPDETEQDTHKYIAGYCQSQPYDIDTYIAVRMKLNELTEDIDMTLPDTKKFAIIYSRICSNITYDYPAGYPKTEDEKKYSKDNRIKCRDLSNGLLKGKCVCAGYADILRSALELVGIEARYISGPIVGERKIQNQIIKKHDSLKNGSLMKVLLQKPVDKLKEDDIENHAWTKVKIDGVWYNADPTWDANRIRNGLEPKYALETDEQCKLEEKLDNPGPKCTTKFPKKEIDKLFGHNNLYIGDFKILDEQVIKREINKIQCTVREQVYENRKKIEEIINKLLSTRKALPSGNIKDQLSTEQRKNAPSSNSWDLSNWNLGISQVRNQSAEIIDKNKKNEIETNNIDNQTNYR